MARSVALARTDLNPRDGGPFEPFLWEPTTCETREVCGSRSCRYQRVCTGNDGEFAPMPGYVEPLNQWSKGGAGKYREKPRQKGGSSDYYEAYGPNLNCPAAILPLTASRAEIEAMIPEMQPWWRGGTLTNWGLVWGWRALSPAWRGWWRRPDGDLIPDLPRDHGEHGLKLIVLMTDGDNMMSHDWSSFQRGGEMLNVSALDGEMQTICTAVKNEGIILYVISFGTVSLDTTLALSACASNPLTELRLPGQKYYHAPGNAELEVAFRDIVGQMTDLRLVE